MNPFDNSAPQKTTPKIKVNSKETEIKIIRAKSCAAPQTLRKDQPVIPRPITYYLANTVATYQVGFKKSKHFRFDLKRKKNDLINLKYQGDK